MFSSVTQASQARLPDRANFTAVFSARCVPAILNGYPSQKTDDNFQLSLKAHGVPLPKKRNAAPWLLRGNGLESAATKSAATSAATESAATAESATAALAATAKAAAAKAAVTTASAVLAVLTASQTVAVAGRHEKFSRDDVAARKKLSNATRINVLDANDAIAQRFIRGASGRAACRLAAASAATTADARRGLRVGARFHIGQHLAIAEVARVALRRAAKTKRIGGRAANALTLTLKTALLRETALAGKP